jgi:hypothetical protein
VISGTIPGHADYSIAPRSAARYAIGNGGAAFRTGVLQVLPNDMSPVGLLIFSYRANGITVTEASVPASRPGSAFRLYVERESGIALANLSGSPANVALELRDLGGELVGISTMTLASNAQRPLFLRELPQFASLPADFQGVLRVTGPSLAVIGLRSRYNERGDVLITTTPPVRETEPPPTGVVVFPHLVNGGGYTTQLVLYGTRSGRSSGLIEFSWR